MKALIDKIRSISKIQILALVLIVAGLGIMVSKGLGMFEFYKEVRYAQENNFKAGNLSTDLLRPWMTLRYISVSYAVPQKYLFDEAGIKPKKENSMISVSRLNAQMNLGGVKGRPVLLSTIGDAINKYRANPVATGFIEQHVSDWMSIQYIANSTGISAQIIFDELGISMVGNAYMPLGYLSDTVSFAGGPKALVAEVQKIIDSRQVQP
ncbi:MAG: hypothetical protein WCK35_05370 [Chloroflexota bacterium]